MTLDLFELRVTSLCVNHLKNKEFKNKKDTCIIPLIANLKKKNATKILSINSPNCQMKKTTPDFVRKILFCSFCSKILEKKGYISILHLQMDNIYGQLPQLGLPWTGARRGQSLTGGTFDDKYRRDSQIRTLKFIDSDTTFLDFLRS